MERLELKKFPVGGPEVEELEERRSALGYPVGEVNGVFEAKTANAVKAIQRQRPYPREWSPRPSSLRPSSGSP